MASLKDLKDRLAKIEAQIDAIYQTGQQYTIVGSHVVLNPQLRTLETQKEQLTNRIFRYHGYGSRVTPDFS